MNKHKLLRAKAARRKMLKARAEAQRFNQSIWSTVSYRHGNKSFQDHGIYYGSGRRQENTDEH